MRKILCVLFASTLLFAISLFTSAQAETELNEEEVKVILKEAYPKHFSILKIEFNAKDKKWDFYCKPIHKECGDYGFAGSVTGSKLKPQLFYVPGEG